MIAKQVEIPIIKINEWPIKKAAMEKQTKETNGNSNIKGFCPLSIFIAFVKPTRNNKVKGIAKYPNSMWLLFNIIHLKTANHYDNK